MKKITGLSLLLAGLSLVGCSENKSQPTKTSSFHPHKIVKTVKTTVTGEWVGRTLLPRSGETKAQYNERLNLLNQMNRKLSRGEDFQPRLSIFTKKGVEMYTWARRLEQANKTGDADNFNPDTDLHLLMAKQMSNGGTAYLDTKTQSQSRRTTSSQANVRRGRTYDF